MTTIPTERGVPREPRQLRVGDVVLGYIFPNEVSIIGPVAADGEGLYVQDQADPKRRVRLTSDHHTFRLLRPVGTLASGTPVTVRGFETEGVERRFEATIQACYWGGASHRYDVRYFVPDGPMRLGGWSTGTGVHPDDLELREVEPTPDPEESPLSEAAEQQAIDAAEMQVAAILDTLTKSGVPRPHRGATPAEWVGHLLRMFEDQSNAVTEVRKALLPIVDDGSQTIDSVAREVTKRFAQLEKAKTETNPHIVNAQSTALREVQELAISCGGDKRLETVGLVRSALGAMEERGHKAGTEQTLQQVHRLMLRYAVPMRRVVPVDFVLDTLETALRERDERVREVTDLARRLTGLGAPPTDTVDSMITFVIAQTRAEARSNATAHAEQAAEAKIRKLEQDLVAVRRERGGLEKTVVGAFEYLNSRIPGLEGFTLEQKIREVVCDLQNKLTFAEQCAGRTVVIASVDQVRAVVQRGIDERPFDPALTQDPGGWFLRTLAAANLAVIRHDWDGIDPTAEPVEPIQAKIKLPKIDASGMPTAEQIQQMFDQISKDLKPYLDAFRRGLGGKQ